MFNRRKRESAHIDRIKCLYYRMRDRITDQYEAIGYCNAESIVICEYAKHDFDYSIRVYNEIAQIALADIDNEKLIDKFTKID